MSETLAKELQTAVQIRFQDCDPFGHLNNARYVDYFLNARQDQIAESYNIRVYEPGMQAGWVVRTTQIAYLRPVNVMEQILIRTRLLRFDATSLLVEGLMLDATGRHVKSLAWVDFCYVSLLNGRPLAQPDELMRLFTEVAMETDCDREDFLRRVEAVRHRPSR